MNNYVYYGITYAGNKQFHDKIMAQDEFVAKYGRPDNNGFVKINGEEYVVYLMDFSLSKTMEAAIKYRKLFREQFGFTEI
jgi:hypothetical protein